MKNPKHKASGQCRLFVHQNEPQNWRGAEAVVEELEFLGLAAVKKARIAKSYRNSQLDFQLRTGRTRMEARALAKAKESESLRVPHVFFVGEDSLILEKMEGALLSSIPPKKLAPLLTESAGNLAKLHSLGIVHGDYTVSNQIVMPSGKLAVIDFGLASVSGASEERALDVLTMMKSLGAKGAKLFLAQYASASRNRKIKAQVNAILSRARYASQQGGA